MSLNVTGGPLEFDAVVNIDQGLKQINALGDAWNSIGDKTKKNAFIDAFVDSLKGNIKELSTQADSIRAKLKELNSVPIGEQDFQGIKNLNDELKKTETAIGFLTQLADNLSNLPDNFNNSAAGANRLSTQLRKIKDDLAQMKAEGKDATPEFASKLDEAAHLEHALHNVNKELELQSSNVAGVEALKAGFQGLVGGAEAFAGAMGLLTDDREKAEVIIKNLIALQSVLNGVEELGAVIDKNSAFNVYLLGLQRKLAGKAAVEQAAGTEVLAVAQTEGAVATEAATVAQTGLNAAMLANPVGAILVAVVALYGAYEILSNTIFKTSDAEKERQASLAALKEAEDKAADATAKEEGELNILIETAQNKLISDERRGKAIDELRSKYPEYLSNLSLENIYTKEASDAIEKQTELIKARAFVQAAEEVYVENLKEQIKKQNELNDTLRNGSGFWKTLWATIKTGNTVPADVTILREKVDELNDATLKTEGSFQTFAQGQEDLAQKLDGTTLSIEDQRKALSDWGSNMRSAAFGISGLLSSGPKSIDDILKKLNKPFSKEDFDAEKKRITDEYQYRIDTAKKGTTEELKARLDMQKALLAFEKTNPTLFDAFGKPQISAETGKEVTEAKKILGDFTKDINDLNEQLTDKALQNATAGANALVLALQAAGQQGSKKYFAAQENALRKSAAEQIVQAKDNAGQIKEIQAKLALDLANLDRDRQKQQLENEKSVNQVRLNLVEKGSKEELQLRLNNIDIETNEELLAAGKNQDKINEINSNAAKKKSDLQKQYAIEAAETETNIRIAGIEKQLAAVREGSDEELNLKKQLIDQKAALDIEEKQKQIKNEKLLSAEISKINAQAIRDKKKLEDDFVDSLLDKLSQRRQTQTQNQNLGDNFIINDPGSTNVEKAQAQLDILKREQADILSDIADTQSMIVRHKGNIDHLQERLDNLNNKLGEANNKIEIQNQKKSVANLQDIYDRSTKIAGAFKKMSEAAKLFNSDLADAVGIIADMASGVANVSKGLSDLKTAKKAKDAAGEIAAIGGIIGAVVGVGNAIAGIFKKARQEHLAHLKELEDFQNNLFDGEFAINELYRQRAREQVTINQLRLQGMEAERKLLEEQKGAIQQDFNTVLTELQKLSGKSDTTTHILNFDFVGIQSLAGKSFDQLEQMFLKGQLEGRAKELFQTLQQLKQEGVDIDKQLQDLQQQAAETFTGTTADSLRDSIAQMFQDGKTSAADFADFFKNAMRQAALSTFEFKFLEPKIKDFFDQFSAAAESGDTLTSTEIGQLQSKFNEYMKQASQQFQNLQQITGLNFTSDTTATQNTLTGAFRTMSEDTGNLLAGQFGAVRIAQLQLVDAARISNNHLYAIETNTFNTVVELRTLVRYWSDSISGARRLKVEI